MVLASIRENPRPQHDVTRGLQTPIIIKSGPNHHQKLNRISVAPKPQHRPRPQLDNTGPSNTNIYKNWAAPSAEVTLNMSVSSLNRGESPDLSLTSARSATINVSDHKGRNSILSRMYHNTGTRSAAFETAFQINRRPAFVKSTHRQRNRQNHQGGPVPNRGTC